MIIIDEMVKIDSKRLRSVSVIIPILKFLPMERPLMCQLMSEALAAEQ